MKHLSLFDVPIKTIFRIDVVFPYFNSAQQVVLFFFQLALAKIMDQGPVLILTFQAQQVSMLTDKKGKAVEGAVVS